MNKHERINLDEILDKVEGIPRRDFWDFEALCNDLNMPGTVYCWDVDDRFKQIPLNTWLCTDTRVGAYLLLYQNDPVAITWQETRKGDIQFYWKSQGNANEVRHYLMSLLDETPQVDLVNYDMDARFFSFVPEYGEHVENNLGEVVK